MKTIFGLFFLCMGFGANAQSEQDFCTSAQRNFDSGNYAQAMHDVGRALVKNPDNADCRKIRIAAALKDLPDAKTYVQALTDLSYLINHRDTSELVYNQTGNAEVGLARELYKVRDYTNSAKHYEVAKEAFQKAKGVSKTPATYDSLVNDVDSYIKQVNSEAGAGR